MVSQPSRGNNETSKPWGALSVWLTLCGVLVAIALALTEPWRTRLIAASVFVFVILALMVIFLTVQRPAGALSRILGRFVVTAPTFVIGIIESAYLNLGLRIIAPILEYGYRSGKWQVLTNPAPVPRVRIDLFNEPFSDTSFKGDWAIRGSVQLDHGTANPSPSLYLGANPLGFDRSAQESYAFFTRVQDLRNGEIEIEADLGSEGSLEILFRMTRDIESGYIAKVSSDNNPTFLKRKDGAETDITRAYKGRPSYPYPKNFRVEFIDYIMTLYADNEVFATALDTDFSEGSLGLSAKKSSKWVHRFVVRTIL